MTRGWFWLVVLIGLVPQAAIAQVHDGPRLRVSRFQTNASARQAPRQRSAAAAKILAEERGDTPEVRALLAGADPNATDGPRKRTALMWSILLNDQAAFRRFMNAKPELNTVDGRGGTALTIAIESAGQYDTASIVDELIAKGATTKRAVAAGGATLLMLAANANSPSIVRSLLATLEPNAIDAPGPDGATALGVAAWMGARDVVYLLIEKGANIDRPDFKGQTPLIRAAGRRFPGTADTVKLLLEMGANPSARDKDGNTAISEAQRTGTPDVVELLKKSGAQ